MTKNNNIYKLNKMELENVVGGGFSLSGIFKSVGCIIGLCHPDDQILLEEKADTHRTVVYQKFRCANCGAVHYSKAKYEVGGTSFCYALPITESEYNQADYLVIRLTL